MDVQLEIDDLKRAWDARDPDLVRLVLTLEFHRNVEHRFLEEPAIGGYLISRHGLELAAERPIEDIRIALRGRVAAGSPSG